MSLFVFCVQLKVICDHFVSIGILAADSPAELNPNGSQLFLGSRRVSCLHKVCHSDRPKCLSSTFSSSSTLPRLCSVLVPSSSSASVFDGLSLLRTTEEVIITGYGKKKKKHLWHLIYFCLSLSVTHVYSKVCL